MSKHVELPHGWVETRLSDVRRDNSLGIDPKKNAGAVFELYSVPSFPAKTRRIDSGQQNRFLENKLSSRIRCCFADQSENKSRLHCRAEFRGATNCFDGVVSSAPVQGIIPKYLAYYMQQHRLRDFLAANASGVGGSLMRVKAVTFRDFPFVVAPECEQLRIVAKIEELFSDLDAGVVVLERVRANRNAIGRRC